MGRATFVLALAMWVPAMLGLWPLLLVAIAITVAYALWASATDAPRRVQRARARHQAAPRSLRARVGLGLIVPLPGPFYAFVRLFGWRP